MSGGSPRRILVDCDPGHDDAVALLLAAGNPDVELLGITTVAGNQTLPRVTRNARTIATVAGLVDVPLHAGSAAPLMRPLRTAAHIHGASGLDGPGPVEPTVEISPGHGATFLAETLLASPGEVTLIATGPLTNLALALRLAPGIVDAVDRVVLMGGSFSRGNVTPAAEFNILVDPEAAASVFGAGWDVTMVGLDVTHLARFTEEVSARLGAIDTRAARFVGELMRFFGASYREAERMNDPPVHDAVAVACVIDPTLVTTRDALVQVECAGRLTSGMTVVDFRASPAPHHVGVDLDVERFWALVLAALAALPSAAPLAAQP